MLGSEFLTSNTAIAFPFRENAQGLIYGAAGTYGAAARLPPDVLVDAQFVLPYGLFGSTSALSSINAFLKQIEYDGAGSYVFTIVDHFAITLASFAVAGADLASGDRFITVSTYTDLGVGRAFFRCVLSREGALAYLPGIVGGGTAEFQTRLPFESSVLEISPPRLLSFALYNNGLLQPPEATGNPGGRIYGHVRITNGHNSAMQWLAPGNDLTEVTLDMIAGAGEGQWPCDDTSTIVLPPMELRPDDGGDMQLVAGEEKCYTIVPHPSLDTFEIQGNCDVCCAFSDYKAVVEAIRRLGVKAGRALNSLMSGRSTYQAGVTHYNANIAIHYTEPRLRVNGMRGPNVQGRFGSPNRARIVASIVNRWNAQLTISSLAFLVLKPGTVDFSEINWEYDGTGGRFTLPALLPTVDLDKRISFTALYGVPLSTWTATPQWQVRMTAVVTDGSRTRTLTETVTFS